MKKYDNDGTTNALRFSKEFNIGQFRSMLNKMADTFPDPGCQPGDVKRDIEHLDHHGLMEMCLDDTFFTPFYGGPYQDFHRYLIRNTEPARLMFGTADFRTEWKDVFVFLSIIGYWRENKQVYVFDPDFARELGRTEQLRIYPELMRRLPYRTFFIDLSGDPAFHPFDGMFVYVQVDPDNGMHIIIYRTVHDLFFSSISYFHPSSGVSENDVFYYVYDRKLLPEIPELEVSRQVQDYSRAKGLNYPDKVDNGCFQDCWSFLMQALMYLASQKPDISENPATRKAYRPSHTVRDKFSEVRKWDVGVVYGKKVRLLSGNGQGDGSKEPVTGAQDRERTHRKPPRPHSRCAHWQRYRTGHGRQNIEIRWIEPTFVGARKEAPVEVHRVAR